MLKTWTTALTALIASSAAAMAAPVTVTLGHVLTEESSYAAAAQTFKEELENSGEFSVQVFPRGQLGGELKMLQAAGVGAVDVVITGAAPLENTVPEISLLSLPYLFDNLDQATDILRGPVGDSFLAKLDPAGLKGLGFVSAIERNVLTSNKKVETVDDMQGLKIRVIQGPAFVETYAALGAQPTPMAYSELYLAVQSGVVDGAEASPDTMISDRFVEVSKYYTLSRAQYMPAVMVMSGRKYDSLTEAQKAIVDAAAVKASEAGFGYYAASYGTSLAKMQEEGVEVVEVDTAPFAEKARTAWPNLMASVPNAQENVDMIEQAKSHAN